MAFSSHASIGETVSPSIHFPPALKKEEEKIKWRLARAHIFHSLGHDQSTVVQRDETTVAECFPDELRVSSFPNRFPHYAFNKPHNNNNSNDKQVSVTTKQKIEEQRQREKQNDNSRC